LLARRNRPNDFTLLVDGKAAGRCDLIRAADNRQVWRWTVYGISDGGMEDTLAGAARAAVSLRRRGSRSPALGAAMEQSRQSAMLRAGTV
jgi:hypothetical protein